MFLAEPPATPYDLHFSLGPFRIRVTPFFWLVAVLLGWNLVAGDGSGDQLNRGMLILLWIAAVFLSILVHELGHALAFRYYGVDCHIVLYHFGGLASPDSARAFGRSRRDANQVVISAAGPAAQLVLAAVIVASLYYAGFSVEPFRHILPYFDQIIPPGGDRVLEPFALRAFAFFLVYPSVMWALLNLLPVYPLDGGQIAREVFLIFDPGNGIRSSLILSIIAGVGIALYAFSHGDTFLALMFGMLAFSSFQILQSYTGYGRRW